MVERRPKAKEIKSNLKGLFMYPQVSGLGSLVAKDKNIKVFFIQNNLLVSPLISYTDFRKPLFKYQTKDSPVKLFFEPFLSQLIFFWRGRERKVKSLLISTNYQLFHQKARRSNSSKKSEVFPYPDHLPKEFEKVPCYGDRFHRMDLLSPYRSSRLNSLKRSLLRWGRPYGDPSPPPSPLPGKGFP